MTFALSYFCVFLTIYVLSAASSFFIPLAISFVTSYLIIALTEGIAARHIPKLIAFIIAIFMICLGGFVIFIIVEKNVYELIDRAPIYQNRLHFLLEKIPTSFQIDPASILKEFDFSEIFKQVLYMLTQIAGSAGIIFAYILFILIEYVFYDAKLEALFPDSKHLTKAKHITHNIAIQIQSYLKIKTWISLITAIAVYTVLKIVGVDFAEFWALLVFFLNYVPTIGSIIATLFPCLLTLLQFDSLIPFIVVTSILISIQFIIGNIIEPRIMGSQFNLSGLVILLSLIIWGKMWGIIGMFLCVPLLMIIKIILANFPSTRRIAVLLSQNGKVE